MCLISFAYKVDARYDLVVAANRDEFYKRPTASASFWDDAPYVLAGRDLEMMGTWMGVTKQGRFAALTNYRDPSEDTAGKRTRGELVSHFLLGDETPAQYLSNVQAVHTRYCGFNLLVGDKESLYYYSNVENKIRKLEPGIYGLSNHLLNTPWPKVRKGKAGLENCLKHEGDRSECLFTSLRYAEQAPDAELPSTGVPIDLERKLSPLFIKMDDYGTRSSTVMFMNNKEVLYTERVYSADSFTESEFSFRLL